MAPAQKLDPPFDLPVRRSTIIPGTTFPLTPVQQDTGKCEFIKHGSPYDQQYRLFVGLGRSWRGIDSIEFKDGSPVGTSAIAMLKEKRSLFIICPKFPTLAYWLPGRYLLPKAMFTFVMDIGVSHWMRLNSSGQYINSVKWRWHWFAKQ